MFPMLREIDGLPVEGGRGKLNNMSETALWKYSISKLILFKRVISKPVLKFLETSHFNSLLPQYTSLIDVLPSASGVISY